MSQLLARLSRRLLIAGAAAAMALPGVARAEEPVTFFAAASLTDVLKAAAASWQAQGHGPVVLSFGSSSTIAKQIEAGAPADLFASADEKWMAYLNDKGLIEPNAIKRPIGNDLVLVGPAGAAPVAISSSLDLAGALNGGRLSVGEPKSVPAGRYAEQALTKLGLWDSVKGSLAPAENVRAALALVQRGEAPLGIVYTTDARGLQDVAIVGTFPGDSHDAIVYPMGVVAGKARPEVTAFFDFLTGAEGKALFSSYGFKILD
jgi:molybdate transport system substrate-binding protein